MCARCVMCISTNKDTVQKVDFFAFGFTAVSAHSAMHCLGVSFCRSSSAVGKRWTNGEFMHVVPSCSCVDVRACLFVLVTRTHKHTRTDISWYACMCVCMCTCNVPAYACNKDIICSLIVCVAGEPVYFSHVDVIHSMYVCAYTYTVCVYVCVLA